MTQEQIAQAKAYVEALNRAKEIYSKDDVTPRCKGVIEDLFPEIRESEDEKTRKELADFIYVTTFPVKELKKKERFLDWLEKQKSVEEIVERCKNSWYNEGKIQGQIEGLSDDEKYQQGWHDALEKQGEKKQDPCEHCKDKCLNCHDFPCIDKRTFEIGKTALEVIKEVKADNDNKVVVEPKFKIGDWVIRSIKNEKRIGIVTEILPEHYIINFDGWREQIPIIYGDCIDIRLWTIQDAKEGDVLATDDGNIFVFDGTVEDGKYPFAYYGLTRRRFESYDRRLPFTHNNIHPATKEQRDLLLQEMKEAGYEWDAEKKELNENEEEYDGEDYGIDSLWHAKNIIEKTLGKVDGYQSDDGILEHKCAITAVKKLYEQNPVWNEEDERLFNSAVWHLRNSVNNGDTEHSAGQLENWIISLRQRMGE